MRALLPILALWRGHAGWLLAGLAVSLLTVAAGVALATAAGGLALHPVSGEAVGLAAVLLLPGVVRGLGVARVVLRYGERMLTHTATFRVLAALRVWLFRGLAMRSSGGLGFMRSGDALGRLVGDVEALDGLYSRIIVPGLAAILLLPVLVGFLARAHGGAAVLVGGLFLLSAIVLPWIAAQSTLEAGGSLAVASAGLRSAALDALDGMREVRAYGAEGRMLASIQAREAVLFQAQRVVAHRASWAQAGAFVCSQAALLAVLLSPGVAPAAMITGLFLTLAAFEVVGGMPRAGALAGHAAGAAARITTAATGPVSGVDPANALPLPSGTSLRFEAVSFRWRPDRPAVLDGLTLDIPAGGRIALLGPSGSGKSTLAALALKVVEPQAGRVLLGGVDVARLRAGDVRSRIAWLSQDTHLFSDTIRANLALAREDASDADYWAALDRAGIADMVRVFPDGLDSWIGEGGLQVSGGQGRRLALARALLSQAPILILDEPATGLDAATERAFLATLNDVALGRTVILIVHRLVGVERLDRIFRLSAGRAVAAAA